MEDQEKGLQRVAQCHEISMDDVVFHCALCGGDWLFNPLMFLESADPQKRALCFCPGGASEVEKPQCPGKEIAT